MRVDFLNSLNLRNTKILTSKHILDQIQIKKKKEFVFNTGSNNFDKVLGGGFHSSKMYLIFGANKTGKTQLCHQMCIQAYKRASKSIYFDSENTFRPERIKELAITQSLNYQDTLKNILVSKVMSTSVLFMKLNDVEEIIKKENIKIIFIDSINNHYRVDQSNRNLSFNKVKTTFLKILEQLNYLTNKNNLIVIATAQITPSFIDNVILNEYPVGIQFLNHYFSELLYLSYKEKESGYVHLINSHSLPEKKILYKIATKGIEDFKL